MKSTPQGGQIAQSTALGSQYEYEPARKDDEIPSYALVQYKIYEIIRRSFARSKTRPSD